MAEISERLVRTMGCYEISLGDTIGVGTPGKARAMMESRGGAGPAGDSSPSTSTIPMARRSPTSMLVWSSGVATVDSSVAGLGGCPYAPGATGNVASEDVLYLLDGLGIGTGVDLAKLAAAGRFISEHLGRPAGLEGGAGAVVGGRQQGIRLGMIGDLRFALAARGARLPGFA